MDISRMSGGNDLLKDLLSFVPVIGNFIDAYDAYQYFKKGNYTNALFSLACAALGPLSKAFKGAKALAKGTKFAQKADKYTDLLKSATKGGKRFSDIADLMITGAKKLGNGLGKYARKGLDALKSSKPINFLQKNVKNLARNTPQKLKNMANAVGATAAAVMKKGKELIEQGAKKLGDKFGKGGKNATSENYVYRALNQKDYERYINGLGLEAKNPDGKWNLGEHLVNGSGKNSWINDPYIATTSDIDVAKGFNKAGSGYGIVKIDMNKVTSTSYKGYEIYPRTNGVEGLPYHYSVWQQEISVYKNIPFEAIIDYFK